MPACASVDPSIGVRTLWYQLTPATSGVLRVHGAAVAIIDVYSGSALGSLTSLGCGFGRDVDVAVSAGTIYYVQVADFYRLSDFTLTTVLSAPPANDAFAAAVAVTPGTTVSGHNVGATLETGEPPNCASRGRTVWYTVTPAASGTLTVSGIHTGNSNGAVAAYTGASLGDLSLIGCGFAAINFSATGGTTYFIQVDGDLPGAFQLSVLLTTNDAFAAAIDVQPGTVTASTGGSTLETGEPVCDAFGADDFSSGSFGTIWYRLTPSVSGILSVTSGSTSLGFADSFVCIYSGSSLGTLTRLGPSGVSAGQTYYIQVARRAASQKVGTFSISITLDAAPSSSASSTQSSPTTATSWTISASATDDVALASVAVYVKTPTASDYALVGTQRVTGTSGTASFSYTATAGDGTYSFQSRATDSAGNVEAAHTSADVAIVYDTKAPSASATSGPSSPTNTSTWTIAASATDSGGLASVGLYVKTPGASTYALAQTQAASGTSASVTFTYTPSAGDGTYGFYSVATDAAGNGGAAPASSAAAQLSVVRDTVPPSVDTPFMSDDSGNTCTSCGTTSTTSWRLFSTPTDNVAIGQATLYVKGPGDADYHVATVADTGDPNPITGLSGTAPTINGIRRSLNWDFTPSTAGTHQFFIVARDQAGNERSGASSFKIASRTYQP